MADAVERFIKAIDPYPQRMKYPVQHHLPTVKSNLQGVPRLNNLALNLGNLERPPINPVNKKKGDLEESLRVNHASVVLGPTVEDSKTLY